MDFIFGSKRVVINSSNIDIKADEVGSIIYVNEDDLVNCVSTTLSTKGFCSKSYVERTIEDSYDVFKDKNSGKYYVNLLEDEYWESIKKIEELGYYGDYYVSRDDSIYFIYEHGIYKYEEGLSIEKVFEDDIVQGIDLIIADKYGYVFKVNNQLYSYSLLNKKLTIYDKINNNKITDYKYIVRIPDTSRNYAGYYLIDWKNKIIKINNEFNDSSKVFIINVNGQGFFNSFNLTTILTILIIYLFIVLLTSYFTYKNKFNFKKIAIFILLFPLSFWTIFLVLGIFFSLITSGFGSIGAIFGSILTVIFLIFFSYLVFLPGILFILIVFFGVSFSYKTLKKKFEWFNRFYHYVILYLLYYGIIIVPLLMVISRVFEVITDKYFNVVG